MIASNATRRAGNALLFGVVMVFVVHLQWRMMLPVDGVPAFLAFLAVLFVLPGLAFHFLAVFIEERKTWAVVTTLIAAVLLLAPHALLMSLTMYYRGGAGGLIYLFPVIFLFIAIVHGIAALFAKSSRS